jgi:hypothetical protein
MKSELVIRYQPVIARKTLIIDLVLENPPIQKSGKRE